MARKVNYTDSSKRIYTNPLLNPNTANVYTKTQAQSSVGAQAPSGGFEPIQDTTYQPQPTVKVDSVGDFNSAAERAGFNPFQAWGSSYQNYLKMLPPKQQDSNFNWDGYNDKATGGATGKAAKLITYRERKMFDLASEYTKKSHPLNNAYVFGGWDCSRFSQAVAAKAGVAIPRTVATQINYFKQRGKLFSQKQAQVGDLVLMKSKASSSGYHVGIYMGNGQMIDNAGRGKPIALRSIKGRNIVGFGRLDIKPPTKDANGRPNAR